ncbi:MAG: T9SS type A sorting domain-containing protein [Prolixibacteraceae bacterium]
MKTNLLLIICFAFLLNSAFSQTTPQDTTSVAQDTTQQNEDESGYIEITLNDAEMAKVDSLVSLLSAEEISGFQNHFDLWFESTHVPEIQIQSNPEYLKTEEYYELKEYTLGLGKAYIGLIIDFYLEHHTEASHYILLYITYDDYGHLLDEIRTELNANQYTEDGDTVYYKNRNHSFANLYFKNILELIQVTNSELIITSAEEMQANALELSVYPNPAHHQFTVSFKLSEPDYPSLKIYNLTGKIVEVRTGEYFPGGTHTIQMKTQLKSGIYLVVLKTGNSKSIKKLIVN